MAKQIITTVVDDLDGGDADETVTFALDGIAYEIDLSSKNASKLREFMSAYQDAGTRIGRAGSPAQLKPYNRGVPQNPNREENQRIRVWALKNGYELAERGRISQHIVDAYHTGKPAVRAAEAPQPEAAEPQPEVKPAVKPARRTAAKKVSPAKFSGKVSA
jgi:hypothetical protein